MIPEVRPWLLRYWRGKQVIREGVEHAPTRTLAILAAPMRWKAEAMQMNPDRFTCTPVRTGPIKNGAYKVPDGARR